MGRRQVKMVSIVICLISLLGCVRMSDSQNLNLSPLQKQAVLVLHDLMKTDPDLFANLDTLLQASNQSDVVVKQLTRGVTEGPLTQVAINALLQGVAQLQSYTVNSTATGNGSSSEPDVNGTAGEPSSGGRLLQTYLQSLQSLVFTGFTRELMKEVTKAASQNPGVLKDGHINTTILLNAVDPVALAQSVVAQLGSVGTLLPLNESMVSRQCYEDFVDTIDSAVSRNGWAIEMIDAFGKPNAGVMRGSFYFTGSYDECYKVKPRINKGDSMGSRTATRSKTFGTRFCRADFNINDFVESLNVDTRGYHIKLIWGMCVPDSCHGSDMKNFMKLGFLEEVHIPVDRVYCVEDEGVSDDKSAIAAIVILAFFGLLIVVGTLYDFCKPDQKPKRSQEKQPTTSIEETKPQIEYENTSFTNLGYQDMEVPKGYMHHREDDTYKTATTSNGTTKNGKPTTNGNIDAEIQRLRTQTRSPQQPLIDRFLLCFSAYTNIPRLLNAKSNDNAISCIHGIRFLSLTWVVLGHTYNYGIISIQETFTASNLLDFESVLQRFTYQAVIAGGYAVDTFFVLSAFLMTWLQLKERAKRHGRCSLDEAIMFYFHRFWRLTPIYMMVLMIYAGIYPHLVSGPFAPSYPQDVVTRCRKNWWTNLLYVNNLVNVDDQCMGWSWYLANDMQFYVISPIFLLIMYMNTGLGAISTLALMGMGIGIAFWKEHETDGNFFAMLSDGGEWWKTVYTVPWCRVHCWAVGMILGLIVYRRERKPLKSKKLNILGWLLATAVALFLVYIPYTENNKDGVEWTPTERAFYESFGRTAWGVCVAWVIFACYTGKGGIVNSILSWNGFIPLSRLAYATYLVHPICMMTYSFNRRNLLYVNDYGIIYLFFGHLVVSHMVAFVCSVAFEAPFMQLEKILRGTGRKKQK